MRNRNHPAISFLTVLALAAFFAAPWSCKSAAKRTAHEECDAVMAVQKAHEKDDVAVATLPFAEKMKTSADILERQAKELSEIAIRNVRLKRWVEDYSATCLKLAAAMRALGDTGRLNLLDPALAEVQPVIADSKRMDRELPVLCDSLDPPAEVLAEPTASVVVATAVPHVGGPESRNAPAVGPSVVATTGAAAVDPEAVCRQYVRFIKAEPTATDFAKCKAEMGRTTDGKERETLDCISRCTMNASDAEAFRSCCASECRFDPPAAAIPEAGADTAPADGRPAGFPDEIPTERSKPPTVQEWNAAERVDLEPKGCFRKVVREWLKLNCSRTSEVNPDPQSFSGLESLGTEGGDYFTWVTAGQKADLVVRMVRGRRGIATLQLSTRTISIGFDWRDGSAFPRVVWE